MDPGSALKGKKPIELRNALGVEDVTETTVYVGLACEELERQQQEEAL